MNQKWEGSRDKTWWELGNGIGLRVNFLVCSGRLFFGFGIGKLASTYTHIHNWSLLPAYLLCGSRLFRLVQSFSLYFPLWILFFLTSASSLYFLFSIFARFLSVLSSICTTESYCSKVSCKLKKKETEKRSKRFWWGFCGQRRLPRRIDVWSDFERLFEGSLSHSSQCSWVYGSRLLSSGVRICGKACSMVKSTREWLLLLLHGWSRCPLLLRFFFLH